MIRSLAVVAALATTAHAGKPVLPCKVDTPSGTPIFEATRYLTANGKRGMVTRLYVSGTYTGTPTRKDG